MTNTTNPMETVESVTKLNKGTSRDQWGNFGFWGFKTPNGKVRARVYDNGMFEVKTFDPTKLPSYRKTMNWEDAQLLGSAFLTVSDADKGPNSTEMVAEINAIVVDLKDYSGTVVFSSEIALSGGKGCQVKDFKDLVRLMHDEDAYVIGRLTVFQDPLYTVANPDQAVQNVSTGGIWLDHKKLSFVDVGAKPFWDYIISLAHEAYDLGVDEINFDTPLISNGYVDSFAMVSLLVFLENKFKIRIPPAKATPEAFDSVNKIVGLVNEFLKT